MNKILEFKTDHHMTEKFVYRLTFRQHKQQHNQQQQHQWQQQHFNGNNERQENRGDITEAVGRHSVVFCLFFYKKQTE